MTLLASSERGFCACATAGLRLGHRPCQAPHPGGFPHLTAPPGLATQGYQAKADIPCDMVGNSIDKFDNIDSKRQLALRPAASRSIHFTLGFRFPLPGGEGKKAQALPKSLKL